ncbi:hypothetical protein ACJX0J_010784, partial [Zea mays]
IDDASACLEREGRRATQQIVPRSSLFAKSLYNNITKTTDLVGKVLVKCLGEIMFLFFYMQSSGNIIVESILQSFILFLSLDILNFGVLKDFWMIVRGLARIKHWVENLMEGSNVLFTCHQFCVSIIPYVYYKDWIMGRQWMYNMDRRSKGYIEGTGVLEVDEEDSFVDAVTDESNKEVAQGRAQWFAMANLVTTSMWHSFIPDGTTLKHSVWKGICIKAHKYAGQEIWARVFFRAIGTWEFLRSITLYNIATVFFGGSIYRGAQELDTFMYDTHVLCMIIEIGTYMSGGF